jgi:phage terminase large subunit-like protein
MEEAAELAGLELYDWQRYALSAVTAVDGDRWRYPEAAIVVARQNGKTTLLVPRIIAGLLHGERILHTAQDRIIPRGAFHQVADTLIDKRPHEVKKVRYANGQEAVEMANGGRYTIVAPRRGVRGHSADLLIIDELREYQSWDFMGAASPTLTASADPQTLFLSNAGDDQSVVFNELRRRGLAGG